MIKEEVDSTEFSWPPLQGLRKECNLSEWKSIESDRCYQKDTASYRWNGLDKALALRIWEVILLIL